MGKPRLFTTLPVAMIADTRPTALDIRCAAAIALRDGMSQVKGKGGGCYAKMATLAEDAGTDVSNFSKSLSRLIGWGYVVREQQQLDKRRFTLRINYPDPKQVGELANKQEAEKVGEPTNNRPELVGEHANEPAEIVGEADNENRRISKENDGHYSSLSEELDFQEWKELNSLKGRTSNFSNSEGAQFAPPEDMKEMFDGIFPTSRERTGSKEIDSAEAGLGRKTKSLWPHLPKAFHELDSGAQVSRLERAFKEIGSDPNLLPGDERAQFHEQLEAIADAYAGEPVGSHAMRLREDMTAW